METFRTNCTVCGEIDHPIDYYSHDEFSYEDSCEVCGSKLANVDSDGWEAIADDFGSQIDHAMEYEN